MKRKEKKRKRKRKERKRKLFIIYFIINDYDYSLFSLITCKNYKRKLSFYKNVSSNELMFILWKFVKFFLERRNKIEK